MTNEIQQARRKAFEAWYLSQYDTILDPEHRGNCFVGYRSHAGDHRWLAFNAALDAVVIELPVLVEPDPPEDAFDDSWRDGYCAAVRYRNKCRAAIESLSLGIKIND